MDWKKLYNKEYTPPIVPGPTECCIDEEFLSLPLDFEDSGIPLPTERRQSCYYESTMMLKTFLEKNTLKNSELQMLYNNLSDDKNVSLLIAQGQLDNEERQPQDLLSSLHKSSFLEEQALLNSPEYKNSEHYIEGLEHFEFENQPAEE